MSKYFSNIIAQKKYGYLYYSSDDPPEGNQFQGYNDVGTEVYSCLEKMPPPQKKRKRGKVGKIVRRFTNFAFTVYPRSRVNV